MSLVRISTAGAVRHVILARPEKRNAINPRMMAELLAAFEQTPCASERVTVLSSEGPVFCAGLQLQASGLEQAEAEHIEVMFAAVQNYPLPVIAQVQGAAIAGGCELALHCDFIVASHAARFAMPLAQIGVSATWFLAKKLIEFAGPATTREFLLLGEPLSASRLYDLGVVTRVCEAEELQACVKQLTDRLSANAPMSMRTMKKLLVQQMEFLMDCEHAEIDQEIAAVYTSDDAVEGVAAKVERRTAHFKGA